MITSSDTESVSQIKSRRLIINQMEQVVKNQTWRIQIIWKTNGAEQQNFVAPYSGAHAQLTPVIMRMRVKYHQAGAENIKICKKKIQEEGKKIGGNQRRSPTFRRLYRGQAQQWSRWLAKPRRNTKVSELSFHNLAAFLWLLVMIAGGETYI